MACAVIYHTTAIPRVHQPPCVVYTKNIQGFVASLEIICGVPCLPVRPLCCNACTITMFGSPVILMSYQRVMIWYAGLRTSYDTYINPCIWQMFTQQGLACCYKPLQVCRYSIRYAGGHADMCRVHEYLYSTSPVDRSSCPARTTCRHHHH